MNALNHLNVGLRQENSSNSNKNTFRATKLWNQVLHSYYIGVRLKTHRKHMKSYRNCFVATEAVDWLLNYLQMCPQFSDQQISRFQAINLLQKYLLSNVIERVNSKKVNLEFQDNKELYRFTTHANENLPFISTTNLNTEQLVSTPKTLKTVENILELINGLNSTQKSEVFKQMFFHRFVSLVPKVENFIKRDEINPLILMHNMTRISANGVVQLTDKSEDLPHWVMSAIKCLANWPKASGSDSCLPKYPGFEADVFALIRDYFFNIGLPLIPHHLYSLLVHIYDEFTNETFVTNSCHSNQLKANQNPSPVVSQNILSANDLKKTLTPILESLDIRTVKLSPNQVFETIFMSDIPVTKIVSIDELTNLFINKTELKSSNSFRTKYLPNIPNKVQENNRYLDAITTMPRRGHRNSYKSPIITNLYKTKYESPDSKDRNGIGYYNFGFAMQSPTEEGEYMLSKSIASLSSNNLLPKSSLNYPKDNISAQFSNSSNNCSHNSVLNTMKNNKLVTNTTKFLEALQLYLLLIPPSNRRHLHLLLRLFSKIIQNKEIVFHFNEEISRKDYILKTFTRSILCPKSDDFYNELKAQKIVSFLIDNCKEIFKVPKDLVKDIDRVLVEKAKQILFNENSKQYCELISTEEFELQSDVLSGSALIDLFGSIMTDDRLTDRDKLKWIKQFKSYHPEVYDLYFTNRNKVSVELKQNTRKTSNKTLISTQNSNLLKKLLAIRL